MNSKATSIALALSITATLSAAADPAPVAGKWTNNSYQFERGFPSAAAAQKAYDDLDLNRAVEAYRFFYPTVSGSAIFKGNAKLGIVPNKVFGTLESQPKHVGFTLNSDTPYAPLLLDLTQGPMVVELPPGWLGLRDAAGGTLDGGKSYKLSVPQPVPGKLFWSVTVYDMDTRSQVLTDQGKAALRSLFELKSKTGSAPVELYFGPKAPPGHESEWIKTIPGKGWFAYFRIYGPEKPAFDGSWKPGDFELVK